MPVWRMLQNVLHHYLRRKIEIGHKVILQLLAILTIASCVHIYGDPYSTSSALSELTP